MNGCSVIIVSKKMIVSLVSRMFSVILFGVCCCVVFFISVIIWLMNVCFCLVVICMMI